MRVVSLLPSTTEIVAALDRTDDLVGRSHECDFPPSVAALPVLTSARLDSSRPSSEIDREVKTLLAEALSIYQVDAELLRELAPDVVLTQSRCEVCAVTDRDVEDALADWTGSRPRIVSLAPGHLESVWRDVERVAEALEVPRRGAQLVAGLRGRVTGIAATTQGLPRPRVFCLEWIDPPMAAGHWIPELVQAAGGDPVFGDPGEPSPWVGWDEVQRVDPDLIVVMPCGFALQRAATEMTALKGVPHWEGLRAVRRGAVYLTDGNAYFNRPGPRLADSAEILAQILHPDRFARTYSAGTWQRWEA